MTRHVDNADGATNLRRHPDLVAVRREPGHSGTDSDQYVSLDKVGLQIDEMGHISGFRRVHQPLAVGADAHPLGLHTDWNLLDHPPLHDIHDGHHIVVFVGDVE